MAKNLPIFFHHTIQSASSTARYEKLLENKLFFHIQIYPFYTTIHWLIRNEHFGVIEDRNVGLLLKHTNYKKLN